MARLPNRLLGEKSPYLLQHAHNPVDWHPWGEAAFEEARRTNKPVFLSIGYATCHWCHVMAHEAFEDEAVAALMNEAFINIKVDREERPDVDGLYMAVCQAMTGHGGWPLNLLLTPDKRPFFAGTYIPKHSQGGRLGLLEWIPRVRSIWQHQPEKMLGAAREITATLREALSEQPPGTPLDATHLEKAEKHLDQRYDLDHGGFGTAPKFPTPHTLLFLLRRAARTGQPVPRSMVIQTLAAMRHGGLFDQLGFGFHRYSTDPEWLLPHFEKMLYDQALLLMAYTEGFQATGEPLFRQVADEIVTYVQRDLTCPHGACYSAEDADSLTPDGHHEEGAFYVWTEAELDAVLGDDGPLARLVYGTDPAGNYEDEATRRRTGANVLHLPDALDRLELELSMEGQHLAERVEGIRQRLLAARAQRPRPLLDDKVLTDWNGLMIAALAKAARAFDRADYLAAARRAADFCLTTLRRPDGRLLHRYRDGDAGLQANLDDYAFLTWGLLELHQATLEPHWLATALDLHTAMERHFGDAARGGYFFSPDDGEALIVRQKEYYDGAVPAGNAVALLNGLRLGRLTGNPALEATAERVLTSTADYRQAPAAYTMALCGVDFLLGPTYEIVLAGDFADPAFQALRRVVDAAFLPNAVVIHRPPGDEAAVFDLAPYTRTMPPADGQATAYVCTHYTCQAPVTTPEALAALLSHQP